MRFGAIVLAIVFLTWQPGITPMARADDDDQRWQSAIFLKTTIEKNGVPSRTGGSGFLLAYEKGYYVVTARHVADSTRQETSLIYSKGQERKTASLGDLGFADSNKWQSLPNYDVALLAIDPKTLDGAVFLTCPLIAEPMPIKRELEFVGFPFALGIDTSDSLSPVVVGGSVASKEIDSPFVPVVDRVVLCTPPIADGTSGGPVFTPSGDGKWELMGVYVGNLQDRSGAKLSKVVPAKPLVDLLRAGR